MIQLNFLKTPLQTILFTGTAKQVNVLKWLVSFTMHGPTIHDPFIIMQDHKNYYNYFRADNENRDCDWKLCIVVAWKTS